MIEHTHSISGTSGRDRRRGLALVAVLCVLFALILIGTPFALSMRDHLQASYSISQKAQAGMAVDAVVAHAMASLARGHASVDPTPEVDTPDEMTVDSSALEAFQNPRGLLASVRVEDEQGKINLNSATVGVLGNLLGVARLTKEVDPGSTVLPIDDASRFLSAGGTVWADGELISYRRVGGEGLQGLSRGERAQAGFLSARAHALGAVVVDARAIEIVRWRFAARAGEYSYYRMPSAIRSISDLGVAAISAEALESILPQVTVSSTRLGAPRFGNAQSFIDPSLDPSLLQIVTSDGTPVYLKSNRFLNPGTAVRIRDGKVTIFTTVGDLQRQSDSERGGPGQDARSLAEMQTRIRERLQASGNVPAEQIENRVQQLTNLFTTVGLQNSVLGVIVGDVIPTDLDLNFAIAETEIPHPVNVNTASEAVLTALLENLQLRTRDDFVSRDEARSLIRRLRKAPVTGWRYFLEEVLERARDANEISEDDLEAIYLSAQNPADIRLAFGTMPFAFKSGDVYTLDAAASVSSAAGVEQARASFRDVVSVAPQTMLTLSLSTQQSFEDHIIPGSIGRWVETYPTHVDAYQGRTMPPSRYPQNRFEKLYAATEEESELGEEQGVVRLLVSRRERNDNVEHFDRYPDNEGFKLDKAGFNWNFVSRLRTREGYMGSGTIRFWVRPVGGGGGDRTLFDAGDPNGENRLTLFYDSRNSRFVFRVSDGAIDDPTNQVPDAMEVTYAIAMQDDTPYHVLAAFRGTKPGDLALVVDGNAEKERPRHLTRLTAAISQGATPGSLAVEDAHEFPNAGTLLIRQEVFEYSGRSQSGFNLATAPPVNSGTTAIGRGWRGTAAEEHPAGSAVELYGYANATTSTVPTGGAALAGSRSLGTFDFGELDSRDPINSTPAIPFRGIDDRVTQIPLRAPGGSGGTRFMDAFQDRGYALIIDDVDQWIVRRGGQVIARLPAGLELIYYGSVSGTVLTNVQRGMTTPHHSQPGAAFTTPGVHLNDNSEVAGRQGQRNIVVPISLWVSGGNLHERYLDPMSLENLAKTERVQVDDEWFRYDSISDNDEFFLRDDLAAIKTPLQALIRSGSPGPIDLPPGPGGGGSFAPPPPPSPPAQQRSVHAGLTSTLRFRQVDGTDPATHGTGADVIPCFRVRGVGVGPGDAVTLSSAGGRLKESHTVHWAAWRADGDSSRFPAQVLYHYVAFDADVSRAYPSTVEPWLVADLKNPSGGNGWYETERRDTRGLTRLLKFPSGELPTRVPPVAVVGAGIDGTGLTPGFLDEVEGTRFRQVQEAATPYMLRQPPGGLGNPGYSLSATETTVTLRRADCRYNHAGMLVPNPRLLNTQPWPYTPLPGDAGIARIDQEWLAYRGLEQGQEANPAGGGLEPWVQLRDCTRGLFGTQASEHAPDAKVTFFEFLPITKIEGGIGAEAASIPVTETQGFLREGTLGFIGGDGLVAELAHYDRVVNNSFEMPMRRSASGSAAGVAIFRGRFGTAAQAHGGGDLLYEMPFRYWDRYAKETDRPEMSFFQATAEIPGAYFDRIEWDERLTRAFHDVKVLVRIDERASWDAEPLGEKNGLFLFEDPPTEKVVNRIGVRGDRIEVRAFFEYLPGAFNSAFTSDSWKDTPWLKGLRIRLLAPNAVLLSEDAQ